MKSGEFHVTCLVDNTAGVGSECRGEHGAAFLVETQGAKVLFDTGQSGDVLAHNLGVLGKDLRGLSAIVLSHGHYDHTGGLEYALSVAGEVDVYAHHAVFGDRVARSEQGDGKIIGIPLSRQQLESACKLHLIDSPCEVAPGAFVVGQVPRGAGPEPSDARLLVKEGDRYQADPLLDDTSLVLETSKGPVVLMGCCHSGVINTLEYAASMWSDRIFAIIGGTHLANVDEQTLRQSVVAAKERYGVRQAYVGHCSGTRGLLAFADVFGDDGHACFAGLSLTF